jgi:hypothetical protein
VAQRLWRDEGKSDSDIAITSGIGREQVPLMAPRRTNTTQILVRLPPAVLAALDASIAGQSPRLSRPEEIRRLVKERLAGEPAPAAPSEDTAELRRQLIRLASKLDQFVAYTRQLEEQRDVLAARTPRLELVSPSPREPPTVGGWAANPRSDPDSVARARAQLAAAEAAAEARRREEFRSE